MHCVYIADTYNLISRFINKRYWQATKIKLKIGLESKRRRCKNKPNSDIRKPISIFKEKESNHNSSNVIFSLCCEL